MKIDSFTITSFVWQKDIEGRFAAVGEPSDGDKVILARLSALASFLEASNLTTRMLTINGIVSKDFILKSDDLTQKGLELIKKGYEKWRKQAKTPEDIGPLKKIFASL